MTSKLWQYSKLLKNGRLLLDKKEHFDQDGFKFKMGQHWCGIERVTGLRVFDEVFCRKDYLLPASCGLLVVLGLGVNICLFSLYAAIQMPYAYIYTIEVDPQNYNVLLDNIKVNGLSNIEVDIELRNSWYQFEELMALLSKHYHHVEVRTPVVPAYPVIYCSPPL